MAKRKSTAQMVKVLGHSVRKGTKKYALLVAQKRHLDDLLSSETGRGRKNPRGRRRTVRSARINTASGSIPAKLVPMKGGGWRVMVEAKHARRMNPAQDPGLLHRGDTFTFRGTSYTVKRFLPDTIESGNYRYIVSHGGKEYAAWVYAHGAGYRGKVFDVTSPKVGYGHEYEGRKY